MMMITEGLQHLRRLSVTAIRAAAVSRQRSRRLDAAAAAMVGCPSRRVFATSTTSSHNRDNDNTSKPVIQEDTPSLPDNAPTWAVEASRRIQQKRKAGERLTDQEPPPGVSKILLHSCCAPCSGAMVEEMMSYENCSVTVYFYNPNIHPRVSVLLKTTSCPTLVETCVCLNASSLCA